MLKKRQYSLIKLLQQLINPNLRVIWKICFRRPCICLCRTRKKSPIFFDPLFMPLILQLKQPKTELFHYYAFSLAYKSKSKVDMENLFSQALHMFMQNKKKNTNFFFNHYLCHLICSKNSQNSQNRVFQNRNLCNRCFDWVGP